MLLADNLLRHGDFTLDRYDLPPSDYRLQSVDGHRYYAFPPGTSILSVPFVAVMRLRGISAVRTDGTYSGPGELSLDGRLAAMLTALFAALVYFTARLRLPVAWSLVLTVVCGFGTQVFSTASRSMWSDTWGILLVGLATFTMLNSSAKGERLNLPLLATLEAWAYVVRPTNALVLVGTALYLAIANRKRCWLFCLVVCGVGWPLLHLFVATFSQAPPRLLCRRTPAVRRRAVRVLWELDQPEPRAPRLCSGGNCYWFGPRPLPTYDSISRPRRAGRVCCAWPYGRPFRIPTLVGRPLLRGPSDYEPYPGS